MLPIQQETTIVKFIHTSDLQLGMSPAFLGEEAARFRHDRVEVIRRIGDVARQVGADFVVAAGDVFDKNNVDPETVARTCDALSTIDVPVYVLPGNHDPLDGATIYRTGDDEDRNRWSAAVPAHVHVIRDTTPVDVPGTNAQIVGAPWHSKSPGRDLNNEALDAAGDVPTGTVRILLGHGQTNTTDPDANKRELVQMARLRAAHGDARVHYAALGDKHSTLDVDGLGWVWFSGAPEVTDFRDTAAGNVLAVTLEPDQPPQVQVYRVGQWQFERIEVVLSDEGSVSDLASTLAGFEQPTRTVVKLVVNGAISGPANAAFERLLDDRGPALAVLDFPPRHDKRIIDPTDDDLEALALDGYAKKALDELREASGDDPIARQALMTLLRVEREAAR